MYSRVFYSQNAIRTFTEIAKYASRDPARIGEIQHASDMKLFHETFTPQVVVHLLSLIPEEPDL